MKRLWIILLAAMLVCLISTNALAIGSYLWDENQVYVISGTQNGNIDIATKNHDEYFLVLDHVVMNGRITIGPMSSSYNQSPTVHILAKGENRITSPVGAAILSMDGATQFVFEPASWDASLVLEGRGPSGPIETRVYPSFNGFGRVYFDVIDRTIFECAHPEFIVPIPGSGKPIPGTGDAANLLLWGGMLAVSAIGIIAISLKARKEY